jgi:hypothetical protein
MNTIIFLIFLLPLGLAATLIVRGVRGYRVGDHPVCSRCGFDLFGQPTGTVICGECGRSLAVPRSVLIGHHQRRPTFIAAGLVILLPMLFAAGTMAWGEIHAKSWLNYAPTRLVLWRATSSTPSIQASAMDELKTRLVAGVIGANDAQRIADAALISQADLAKPWNPNWGDLLETLHASRQLPDAKWKQYLNQSWIGTYHLTLRPRVRRGDPLPYRIEVTGRRSGPSAASGLMVELTNSQLQWVSPHGVAPSTHYVPLFCVSLNATGISTTPTLAPADFPQDLPDGNQQLHLTGTVNVGYTSGSGANWTFLPIVSGTIDLPANFTLLPANEPTVKRITDAAMDAAIRKSIKLDWIPTSPWGPGRACAGVQIDSAPTGLSLDMLLRHDGKETHVATFNLPPRGSINQAFDISNTWFTLGKADVIFRSNPASAAGTVDMFEVWDGEIVFTDVPVK